MISILNDTIKNFRNKYFHSFEHKCVYEKKFINMENNGEVFLTITLGYMKYSSQSYGLSKKTTNATKNCFRIGEIVKLAIKIDWSLSNQNICYYSKLPIPILHTEFSRKNSQNPQTVKDVCIDRNNPFHFGCRRWINNQ